MKHPPKGRKSSSAVKISFETSRFSDSRLRAQLAMEGRARQRRNGRSWTLTLSFFRSGKFAASKLMSSILRHIAALFSIDA
jgi:hypothetical protein